MIYRTYPERTVYIFANAYSEYSRRYASSEYLLYVSKTYFPGRNEFPIRKSLIGQSHDSVEHAYQKYRTARKALNKDMLTRENNKWNTLLKDNNSKKLWYKINWNGKVSNNTIIRPDIEDLVQHFEKLYASSNPDNETDDIMKLS